MTGRRLDNTSKFGANWSVQEKLYCSLTLLRSQEPVLIYQAVADVF